MNIGSGDIIIIIFVVLGAVGAGLYFLNRWAYRKMDEQQNLIERNKQSLNIYVIDKKKEKAANSNLPKAALTQLPRIYKYIKMPLVKAKIGPQIMTLMCDKNVFEALPVKKNVSVELAGIYIVNMKGMKSKKEMKEIAKAKKEKAKKE